MSAIETEQAAVANAVQVLTVRDPYFFYGECVCGEVLHVPNTTGWQWLWMGAMEFLCPKCGHVLRCEKRTMM